MSLMQLMNKTVTIRRQVNTPDGMGGFETICTEIGQTVARISPTSSHTRAQYNQIGVAASHMVVAPSGADVCEGDQLIYGTRVLKINGITDPSEAGHHLELVCEEVR
jgi:SPP1 family predicted phage head-tail adaptor